MLNSPHFLAQVLRWQRLHVSQVPAGSEHSSRQHQFHVSLLVGVPPHVDAKLLEAKPSLPSVILAPMQCQGLLGVTAEESGCGSHAACHRGPEDSQLCGSLPKVRGCSEQSRTIMD